jgi:hypothetical protein
VAGAVRDAGLIAYGHRTLRIVDRSGLDRAACPCYRTMREYAARLGF